MDRKEKIFEYIKSEEYIPLKTDELVAVLGVPESDFDEFHAILDELIMEGKIFLTKKQRYMASDKNTVVGKLRCNRNGFFGFVEVEGEEDDVYVSRDNFSDAIDGDIVAVTIDIVKKKDSMREGHIARVIKRGNKNITGVITKLSRTLCYVKPDNEGIIAEVSAPKKDFVKKGMRVLLEIKDYSKNGSISCEILESLGDGDDVKSCIEATIYKYEVKQEFDEETLKDAGRAPREVTSIDGRRDLRDELIFTIDGDDARDFDDAVSLEKLENGNFKLGVHIADVTHYVKEGTALDDEAFLRGTSVYLADRVIPMLPVELSNGICSLNPGVDRYTLSLFMEIDKDGNVLSHELFKGVICSKERLTYNIAAELLEGEDADLKKKYKHVLQTLKRMKRVATYLNRKRVRRGSINFDFPEAKIRVDENGYPVDIVKEERNIAHKIIEEFMLVANETVAEYAFWAEIPFVYRVHESPSPDKIDSFQKFIFNFGLAIKGRTDKEDGIHPKALQKILDKIEGTPEEAMISKYMLRSLMKAEYKPENLGHFGLAAKYYCHFTSPIRRYPDLMVHRILKDFLDGKSLDKYEMTVWDASKNSSETERNAELIERDVDDIMKAQFMSEFLGENFKGRISGVTKFGLFVELDNTVEGLIRLENMHDDYYIYDEERRMVIGERKKRTYKIGDTMSVMLVKCDIMSGSIDFLPGNATISEINRYYSNVRKKQKEKNNIKKKEKKKYRKKGRRHGKF